MLNPTEQQHGLCKKIEEAKFGRFLEGYDSCFHLYSHCMTCNELFCIRHNDSVQQSGLGGIKGYVLNEKCHHVF